MACYFFATQKVFAQDKIEAELPYKHYTVNDGLPSNETYYALQDKRGYLWISTDKGVSRFNGYEFENFTTADGLIDNTIFNMTEDEDGRIWFAGYNNKLCYWDWNSEKFVHYIYNDDILKYLNNKYYKLIIDFQSNNNDIYIGYVGAGLLKISLQEGIVDSFNYKKLNYFKTNQTTLVQSKYTINKEKEINFSYIYNVPVQEKVLLVLMKDDIILKELGLYKNDTGYKNIKSRISLNWATNFIVTDNLVFYTQPDFIYNSLMQDAIQFKDVKIERFKKIGNTIIKIDDGGIFELNEKFEKTIKISPLKVSETTNIFSVADNYIITTQVNGLFVIPKNSSIVNYSPFYDIHAIFSNGDSIIIYTLNKQYYFFNNEFITLNRPLTTEEYKSDNITAYALSSSLRTYTKNNNEYCLGTLYDIRFTSNQKTKQFQTENYIFTSCYYKGLFIFGTSSGLLKMENDSISPFLINKASYKDLRIQCLNSLQNLLLISTRGNGLFIANNDTTFVLTEANGLPSNIINCTTLQNDTLWIGTNKGIVSIKIYQDLSYRILNYITTENGLLSPDILQLTINDNKLYVGCDNNLSIVNYDELNKLKSSYNLLLNGVVLFNNQNIIQNNDTVLPYTFNQFQFNYTAITPLYLGSIQYRYKLNGLDENWHYTYERSADYNNIQPGKYSFIVQAKNEQGEWSKTYPSYNFTIKQPYWKTWLFILFEIGIALVLISSGIYIYLRNQHNKLKMTRSLDKSKEEALISQMNPHFIYNSLNSIQNYVVLKEKGDAAKYLAKFANLMRNTFENSKSRYISLDQEIVALQSYLDLEKMRFENVFTYEFIIASNIDTSHCYIPTLLIQPFLENAIWHGFLHKNDTFKTYKIEIKIDLIDDMLNISIKDNGIGRIASAQRNKDVRSKNHISSGIELTKTRLELINKIENKKYQFEVIDLYNEKNIAQGTLVKFNLPFINILPNETN